MWLKRGPANCRRRFCERRLRGTTNSFGLLEYSHGIRREWTDKNPITQVRQSAKALQDSDCLVSGRNSKALLLHQGTMPDCGHSRCGKRLTRGRTVGIEVGRCEIRSARIERYSLRFPSGRHSLQDGSFTQTDSHESRNCRHALEMDSGNSDEVQISLHVGLVECIPPLNRRTQHERRHRACDFASRLSLLGQIHAVLFAFVLGAICICQAFCCVGSVICFP